MRPSPTVNAPRPSPQFDEYDFRRSMNDIGRAYRNQAIELIALCRLFAQAAEQGFAQDAELTRVLQTCDLALSRAAEARKGLSPASTESIELAIRELREYESTYHPLNADGINSVRERMKKAKQKDEGQSKKALLDRMLGKGTGTDTASLMVVEFHLMGSLTDTQPTIVRQELTNRSKPQEILWNFSRCCGRNRLTLAKNPHFYHRLPPTSPNETWDEFTLPTQYNWHTHPIYVLTNIPGRIYLECGPNRRAFDNVWNTNGALVFKGVCGRLWGESIVGASIQDRPCFWCLVEPPPPESSIGVAVVPPSPAWMPAQDWKDAIFHLLLSPSIKIRIAENT